MKLGINKIISSKKKRGMLIIFISGIVFLRSELTSPEEHRAFYLYLGLFTLTVGLIIYTWGILKGDREEKRYDIKKFTDVNEDGAIIVQGMRTDTIRWKNILISVPLISITILAYYINSYVATIIGFIGSIWVLIFAKYTGQKDWFITALFFLYLIIVVMVKIIVYGIPTPSEEFMYLLPYN